MTGSMTILGATMKDAVTATLLAVDPTLNEACERLGICWRLLGHTGE